MAAAAVFYTLEAENEVTISGLSFNGSNVGSDEGGAIANSTRLTVRDCYFSNNSARLGGAIANRGQLLLENCTFSQNSSDVGGVLFNSNDERTTAMLRNCTLSGNISVFGGGIANHGELSIDHCTITRNSVDRGGGSGVWASPFAPPVQVSNSIIAGNFTDGNLGDVDSSPDAVVFQSNGYNVIGVGNAAGNFNNNDQIGVTDPLLFPLADNGGPTPTHALRPGSPAISAGNPNFAPPPSFDQRGDGFPRVRNGRLDVGAYESETRLALTINDVTVSEGDSGQTNATFQVRLSIPSTRTVTVNATTSNGTARAPGDYTSGSATLSFAPGEISKTFSVPVQNDLLNEAEELFYVILSSPVNAPVARGRGVGTITDNDEMPAISIERVIMREGNSGQRTAAFRLTLSAPSGQVVRVNYSTIAGNATPGDDYVAVTSKQVTFNTGSVYAYAPVLINGDELNELDEYFKVQLSHTRNVYISDGEAEGFIGNDDRAPALTISDAQITEGPAQGAPAGTKNLTFTVTLSKASGQTVTVNYATADGTARSTSDYVAENGVLRFLPNTGLTRQISITINGDTLVEGDETLFVLLSGATTALTNASIGRGRGVGTIINDDTSG